MRVSFKKIFLLCRSPDLRRFTTISRPLYFPWYTIPKEPPPTFCLSETSFHKKCGISKSCACFDAFVLHGQNGKFKLCHIHTAVIYRGSFVRRNFILPTNVNNKLSEFLIFMNYSNAVAMATLAYEIYSETMYFAAQV